MTDPLPPRLPASRPPLVMWPIIVVTGLCFLAVAPLIPSHASCRDLYQERIRHSREPQVTPDWAAAIRAYAEKDGCRACGNTGLTSLLQNLD